MNDIGCGDSSCIFNLIKKKGGQHTNGGCRCFEYLISWNADAQRWNRDEVRKVQQDTQRLANELRRSLEQLKAIRKQCEDRLAYGESDDWTSEVLQILNKTTKL